MREYSRRMSPCTGLYLMDCCKAYCGSPATIAALTLPIRLCSAVILAALIVGHTAKLVYGSYVYVYAVNSFCTFMLHPEPRDRLIPVSVLYVGINSESIKVGFPAFHVNK